MSSHLNYCNSLLYGITDIDLTRLQRVQNRLVTKPPPFTCSLLLLRTLQWLPVRSRILFKIILLTYRALHEKQPVYLHSMLATSLPSPSPRSNKDNRLSVPRVKTNTGARAFHSCAPFLWNNRPLYVRSANSVATSKKHLDTSLWLDLSPIDTGLANGLLMLWNCFLDFAVEHWFSCCATEPGLPGIMAL